MLSSAVAQSPREPSALGAQFGPRNWVCSAPLMSPTAAPEPGAGTTLAASPIRVAVRVRPTDVGQTGNVVLADGHIGSAIRVQNDASTQRCSHR